MFDQRQCFFVCFYVKMTMHGVFPVDATHRRRASMTAVATFRSSSTGMADGALAAEACMPPVVAAAAAKAWRRLGRRASAA